MKRIFKGRTNRNEAVSSPLQPSAGKEPKSPSRPLEATLERTVPATSPEKINGEILKAHIEVCARIRPLNVQTGGHGYFTASKPAAGRRRMGGIKLKANDRVSSRPATTQKKDDSIVAWNVSGDGETAAQSPETELVQGRTHSYTLDHMYGPEATTAQLYQRSIKSLVDRTNRSDLWIEAAKTLGVANHPTADNRGVETFVDGKTFNAADPGAYLKSLSISRAQA